MKSFRVQGNFIFRITIFLLAIEKRFKLTFVEPQRIDLESFYNGDDMDTI